jgi:hypothetical protein
MLLEDEDLIKNHAYSACYVYSWVLNIKNNYFPLGHILGVVEGGGGMKMNNYLISAYFSMMGQEGALSPQSKTLDFCKNCPSAFDFWLKEPREGGAFTYKIMSISLLFKHL